MADYSDSPIVRHFSPGGYAITTCKDGWCRKSTPAARHPGQTIAIIGHADLIKAAVAHYLGVHFDLFQRIVISTASITTIIFTPMTPRVVSVNDTHHNPPLPAKEAKP